MVIEPPQHLSEAARSHLLQQPEPVPDLDATDPVAVRGAREVVHAEWLAVNDDLTGRWCHREGTVAGIPVVWFGPEVAAFDRDDVIVHLHGGAYLLGSPMANAAVAVPVAQRTGLPVVSVDYRLAPEHRCPAAVDDAVAVATELGEERRLVAMFGESAGGGLAVATTIGLRDAGSAMPERLGLISPWVDLTCSGDSYSALLHVDPDFKNPAAPPNWAAAYAGDDTASPQASPLFADLSGLPPALIQVGSREVLLSDSLRLHRALRQAGVESTLDVWDGLWHVWHSLPTMPETMEAFDQLADFLTATTT